MNKRGQIYILSAIIIAFVLYMIFTPTNIIIKTTESSNFEDIAKNFDRESTHFLNHIIDTNQPIYNSFLNFTILFTSFSKTKNPDFGLIYTFAHKDKLYIGNYAEDQATITTTGSTTSIQGCLRNIKTSVSAAGLHLAIPQVNIMQYTQCLKELSIPSSNIITIDIHEQDTGTTTTFTTEIAKNNPDIIIISKEKQGQTRKIYTKGKFI